MRLSLGMGFFVLLKRCNNSLLFDRCSMETSVIIESLILVFEELFITGSIVFVDISTIDFMGLIQHDVFKERIAVCTARAIYSLGS